MKKFLFFFLILGMSASISAQQVEVIGIGMHQQETGSIPVIDDANLVDVTLFSVYLNSNGETPTGDVNYWDNTPENIDVAFQAIPAALNYCNPPLPWQPLPEEGLGYYKTVFDNDVDATGENIIVDAANTENTFSFYAFVERNDPSAEYYSAFDYTHVHCWANGPGDAHTYELEILDFGLNRNVTITMPFSGLENNEDNLNRVAVVKIAAYGTSTNYEEEYEFIGNSVGDYFHLFTSDAFDMPDGANKIFISVYSPNEPWGDNDPRPMGDSFMCGGVVADVTQDDPGCTLTQGYWKTHSKGRKYDETWDAVGGPDADFFLSNQSYIQVMKTPVKGNAYYILAYQYIAAELNFYNGANPSVAFAAFTAATALFGTHSPADIKDLDGDDPLRQQFVNLGGILADYNEGTIGPGHCDDKSATAEFETSTGSEINVYPNPMSTSGTIDFTVANEDQTTVEMYNLMGQKVATLFDQPTQLDQKYQIRIDANRYQKGLYVIYLKNGSSTVSKKVNIN